MPTLLNTTDILGNDIYPINGSEIRDISDMNDKASEEPLGKLNIPTIQIVDLYIYITNIKEELHPPTLQEMINMSWQAVAYGAWGFFFYSLIELYRMDKIIPIAELWKNVITFTDQLWEYKDIILSIDKVNKIEYVQNYNVTFGKKI